MTDAVYNGNAHVERRRHQHGKGCKGTHMTMLQERRLALSRPPPTANRRSSALPWDIIICRSVGQAFKKPPTPSVRPALVAVRRQRDSILHNSKSHL